MVVGKRIKQRRLELGLSQLQLAEKMGYKSKSVIAHIENDDTESITTKKLEKFAEALECSENYLLGYQTMIESNPDIIAKVTNSVMLPKLISDFDKLNDEHKTDIIKQVQYFIFLENKN